MKAHSVESDGESNNDSGGVVNATEAVAHIHKLLADPIPPVMTPELSRLDAMPSTHAILMEIRRQLTNFAKGEFTVDIDIRGFIAGSLKSLQANLRHLVWRMHRVEAGDLNQRADFMGQFSSSFNKMVSQLDDALTNLRQKEGEMIVLAKELEVEVEKRGAALAALQESEENFKYLAEHDPLTGILNRRSFFARAEMERAKNGIMDHYSAVALMDVDHFKLFNDTYGHPNGDIALRHIARIGSDSLRGADIIGRYGGEEFIFLFSNSNVEQAIHAVERIRLHIAQCPVPLPDGEATVTASFGLTAIPPGLPSRIGLNYLQFAVGLADAALYQAKEEGRNRVRFTQFPTNIPTDLTESNY